MGISGANLNVDMAIIIIIMLNMAISPDKKGSRASTFFCNGHKKRRLLPNYLSIRIWYEALEQ